MGRRIVESKQVSREAKTMQNDLSELVDKAKAILNEDDTNSLSRLVSELKNNQNEMHGYRCVVRNNQDDIFDSLMDNIYDDDKELSIEQIIQSLNTEYEAFSTIKYREIFLNGLNQSKDEKSAILLGKILNIFGYIDKTILDEIKVSVSSMGKSNGNYSKINETITSIPFGIKRQIKMDYQRIKELMDLRIYGMDKVKEEIINMIALNNNSTKQVTTPIILYGPPGVGKTIFAEILAEALGLPFYKINFSSAYDRSTIKGANRTWNNSSYGEITRILIKAQCMNPVILLDEIDKAGGSSAGNSIETLTELLDPTQRCFKDDYLLITYDMSNAYIVCTANDIERVPPHIKDRCRVIKVSNYRKSELFNITKDYLPNQIVNDLGLRYQLELDDAVVNKLIHTETLRTIRMIIVNLVGLHLRNRRNIRNNKIVIEEIPENMLQEYIYEVQRTPIGFGR